MEKFEEYLKDIADHEEEKAKDYLANPRQKTLIFSGIHLNWLGDFVANPKLRWEERELPVTSFKLTGASEDWNEILIKRCERSVTKLQELLASDPAIKEKFEQESSTSTDPILVRHSDKEGQYKVLDGMHRFVGTVVRGQAKVKCYLAVNEDEILPICEPHTVYDLLRAYQRHARDEAGKTELYHALKLLARTYENVPELLRTRFDKNHVFEEDIREIIAKVLAEI